MAKDDLVQKNIRFPQSLWDRVEQAADKGDRSEFIRRAVEEYLEPLEMRRELAEHRQRLQALESRPTPEE